MTDEPGEDASRREPVTSAAALPADGARARVAGLRVEDVSVAPATLTVAPTVTAEWSGLPRAPAELSVRVAASVPAGPGGEVARHAGPVSGPSGSYSHDFAEQDLLAVLDAEAFADRRPAASVDLSAGLEFYDADGEQFGPAPVDLLTVDVSMEATDGDTCRAEPVAREGVAPAGRTDSTE